MFCVEGSKVQGVGCPHSVQVPWAIRGQPLLWPLFRCFAVWPVDLAGALFAVLQEGDGSVDGCRDFLRASVISQGDEKAYMYVDWLADKETDCVVEGYGKTIALADVE